MHVWPGAWESLLDRRMGALSGGELQRVLLALALEPLPHILVLDEPSQAWTLTGRSSFWTCWTRSVPAMTCPSSCPPTTSPPWASLPTR
ncbi:MAG: ATP-binding cassette domain-containing protein [Flavonifractor plautii]